MSAPDTKNPDVPFDERIAVYRYFRNHWLRMLNGQDRHAISKQVTSLLSADLEFRTLHHARALCKEASVGINGMALSFIDMGFLCHQAFAIRRITEDYDGQRKKAVYSLPRIISEMESNSDLLTRDVYVSADGDAYDSSDPFLEFRHEAFDKISGKTASDRSPSDVVKPIFFKTLRKRLDLVKGVREYANRYLAHAADPSTRTGSEQISLQDLDAAYAELIWVTNQLSSVALFGTSHVFLPHFVFDSLENICSPLCPADQLKHLQAYWDKRRDELEQLERTAQGQETLT